MLEKLEMIKNFNINKFIVVLKDGSLIVGRALSNIYNGVILILDNFSQELKVSINDVAEVCCEDLFFISSNKMQDHLMLS